MYSIGQLQALDNSFQTCTTEFSTETNQTVLTVSITFSFLFLDLWLIVGSISYSRGLDSLTNPIPVCSSEVRSEGEGATWYLGNHFSYASDAPNKCLWKLRDFSLFVESPIEFKDLSFQRVWATVTVYDVLFAVVLCCSCCDIHISYCLDLKRTVREVKSHSSVKCSRVSPIVQ